MTLKYYIDSQLVRGVQVEDDVYIESDIIPEESEKYGEGSCTHLMSLILYKVSRTDHLDPESPDLQDENPMLDRTKSYVAENKKFLPETKEKV
jgi:hypothetical protein